MWWKGSRPIPAKLLRDLPEVRQYAQRGDPPINKWPGQIVTSSFPVPHWKKIWSNNPWSVSTRRSDVAPMSWASSLTDQPCVAWLAPSSLNSTTNGPSAVDTSHPPF